MGSTVVNQIATKVSDIVGFQCMTIQIERSAASDNDFLKLRVLEQLDSLAVLGCFECFVKRRVLHAANLSNIAVRLDTVRAVAVVLRLEAFCAVLGSNCRRERAAGDCDLVGCGEVGLGLVRPVVGLDSCVAGLSREDTFGDRDRAEALVAGTVDDGDGRAVLDCAVVLGLGNRVAGNLDLSRCRNRSER